MFGLLRFEVWYASTLLGSFPSIARAELHVDARIDDAESGLAEQSGPMV